MSDDRWCRQCLRDPAREDGFCSDYCADQYDRELMGEEEGGEA